MTSRYLSWHQVNSSERLSSSEQVSTGEQVSTRGVEGVDELLPVSIYIHKQPLKKIATSRGFYHGQESNPMEINVDSL